MKLGCYVIVDDASYLFKAWHNFNREHLYKLRGFLPAFRRNVFFGDSGFEFMIKTSTCVSKVHFWQPSYKVISAFVMIGSFQFDNLTGHSSRKEAELKSYKDHCRFSLSGPPARRSKANLRIINPYGEPVCRLKDAAHQSAWHRQITLFCNKRVQ